MSDIRSLLNTLSRLDEAEDIVRRRVQSNGNLTNFNINDDDPSKYFKGLRNGGESYGRDDIVRVFYRDEERLQAFLNGSDGRGAVEVDQDGNPVETSDEFNTETVTVQPTTDGKFQVVDADGKLMQDGFNSREEATEYAESQSSGAVTYATEPQDPAGSRGDNDAPQTDDELDADSADSGESDGQVELSDGSSFNPGNERSRTLAAQRAGELLDRYRELMRKMNESAPSSIKGYLKEYNLLEAFLVEALTDEERRELADVISDLRTIISADGLLSSQNQELFRREIADAPDLASLRAPAAAAGDGAASTDDADSIDSGTPPEAERASDASGDQDATVDPGEGETSSSLEAFANSGKGGLANDPDEVDAITELQQYLTDLGFDPNGVDGKYGRGTIAAVKEFQKYFGAVEDGDAGPETIGKIIQLRGIRWGEGGSKTFVDWRNTMTRMEELISKAGNATESADRNSMTAILEVFRRLDEALSDQEADDLQGIIDELRSAYEDGEFTAALPPNVAERFTSNFRSAEGVLSDMGRGGDEEEPAADGETDAEAEAFDAQTIVDKLKDAIDGAGTDEEAVYAAIEETGSADNWAEVVRLYPEVYDDIYGDFSGTELELVKSKLQNIGVTMPAEGQPQDPAGGEPDADGNVEPRPNNQNSTQRGRNLRAAQSTWDRRYGETHNADGTPKGSTEEPEPEETGADNAGGEGDQGEQLASAREVWNQIKAMRDEQPAGPERVRLSNLMNQINVSTTTPEDAAEILAQAQNPESPSDAEEREVSRDIATGADAEAGSARLPTSQEAEGMEVNALEQRILDTYTDEMIEAAWPELSQEEREGLADILTRGNRPVPGVTTSMNTGPIETDF